MANKLMLDSAEIIENYNARVHYYELDIHDSYPFIVGDKLDFKDCEIFQQRGICTFNLIIDDRKAFVHIPSRILLWKLKTL